MDTTLRDGEQTSGVSFSTSEKLTITQLLLEELKVDRAEIASARVSDGEFQSVKSILTWAETNGYADRIEILTFVDNGVSIDWMRKSGARVQNLLTNTWFLYGVVAALSGLMVSDIPIMSNKPKDKTISGMMPQLALLAVSIIAIIILGWLSVPIIFIAFVLLSLLFKKQLV